MTATGKHAQTMAALFARASLLTSTGPRLPISFPEGIDPATQKPFVPPTDHKYLRVNIFPNVPRWSAVDAGVLDQGLLQVGVIWPKSHGAIEPANVAGQVIAHFPKNLILFSGSTRVKINNDPWMTSPIPENDDVFIPVTIPWVS